MIPFTGGTPLQPWMSLAITNRHEKDNQMHFDEPTHVYTVNGSSKGIVSITKFHHEFFPHFDADLVIKKMMNSKNWPSSKWHGMTAQEIKDAWNNNGKQSSEAGTAMHLGIEMFMNGAEHLVPAEVKDSIEWKYFTNYWKIDSEIWEPFRTEWEVWNEELKLAGSIDMVFRNKNDGTYAIYDWKRSKEIKMENRFERGFGPMADYEACNYWQYTCQLNLYRWLLEKDYGIKISEMALVVLHPDNKNYKKYRLNRLEEEVEEMMECRRRAVKEGLGRIVVFDTNNELSEQFSE